MRHEVVCRHIERSAQLHRLSPRHRLSSALEKLEQPLAGKAGGFPELSGKMLKLEKEIERLRHPPR